MSEKTGRRLLRFLPLVTVMLVGTVNASRVWGQDLPWYVPNSDYFSGPPSIPDSPIASGDSDYWIVSSRCCPQNGLRCCQRCRFDFRYFGDAPRCGRRLNRKAFLRWLKPGVPVCIVVHGSYLRWETVRKDAKHLYDWIRSGAPQRPIQVVFYTWSSDSVIPLLPHLDIAILGRRSGYNGLYLAQLVTALPAQCPISLLGHSHGARTISAGLHLLAGGSVQDCRWCDPNIGRRRLRAVFVAAAMDHHWLDPGERFQRALWPVEGLLNFHNSDDLALSLYPLRRLFSHRALGRTGFQRTDFARLGWFGGKISQIEVERLIGRGHGWAHYYNHPEIASLMAPYLYFAAPQDHAHHETTRSKGNRDGPPRRSTIDD